MVMGRMRNYCMTHAIGLDFMFVLRLSVTRVHWEVEYATQIRMQSK